MNFKTFATVMCLLSLVIFVSSLILKMESLGWFNAFCWAGICATREK